MTLFSPYAALKTDAGKSKPEEKPDSAKPAAPADDEIKALKERLIDMQQQLDKIAKGT